MPIETPNDPPRPGRIILPGAAGEPAGAEAPRIVLPPGVHREEHDELPERPRLRPLVLAMARQGERDVLVVTDPLGVMPAPAALSVETLGVLQLLDGNTPLNDLTAAVMRESKDLRVGNMLRDFIAQLDQMLMLDSPRFEQAYRALREQYHALEIRQAVFEGHAYPEGREACGAFVDAHFAEAEETRVAASEPARDPGARPRALLAPHLDPRRAGPALARALAEIGATPAEPLRVIVYGTGHQLVEDVYALTRKHFETPFGRVECDTAFVDAVAARLGDAAYRGELAHRDEHSIEFAAVYLRRRLGDRPFRIVPLLCGGFHALMEAGRTPRDDAGFESLLAALRDTLAAQARATVHLAAVDLSHVGPRFGDARVDEHAEREVEAVDRAALDAAARGDADAWFAAIAEQQDVTRICGFAPTYAMLRVAEPAAGRLLRYERSPEPDSTVVSVAAMVWD
jgi:hypothetical protein